VSEPVGSPGPSDAIAPRGLEAPTGTRRVRGPTLFVLGLAIAVAGAAIVRTCVR